MTPSRQALPKVPVSLESLCREELPYGGNRLKSTPNTGSIRGSTDSWFKRETEKDIHCSLLIKRSKLLK